MGGGVKICSLCAHTLYIHQQEVYDLMMKRLLFLCKKYLFFKIRALLKKVMNDNHIQWTFQIIFHSISSYAMSLLRHFHLYVNCYFLFWQNRQEIHWREKKVGVNPVFHFTLQGFANIISQNNFWNNIEQYKCVLFIPSLTWILVLQKSRPQSQNICFCSCLNTHWEIWQCVNIDKHYIPSDIKFQFWYLQRQNAFCQSSLATYPQNINLNIFTDRHTEL